MRVGGGYPAYLMYDVVIEDFERKTQVGRRREDRGRSFTLPCG